MIMGLFYKEEQRTSMISSMAMAVILMILLCGQINVIEGGSEGSMMEYREEESDPLQDCYNDETEKMGACFIKPTNKMKNNLNRCKCEVYPKNGGTGPGMKNGKKTKCTMGSIEELSLPARTAAMMVPDFSVKMCFWTKMGLIGDKHLNFDKFADFIDMFGSDPKVKEALKSNITACSTVDPLPDVKYIERVPGLLDVIKQFLGMEEFQKFHCMGEAFGKICSDVPNFNMDKLVDKIFTTDEKKER